MKGFGIRMKQARKDACLKQIDLAKTLGVSAHQIIRYENDQQEPKLEGIVQIAKTLHVSSDYLLGLTDKK